MIRKFMLVLLLLVLGACSQKQEQQTKVENGHLETIGNGEDEITVAIVKGSPYEMGEALGQLLKGEIEQTLSAFLELGQNALPERFSDEKLDAAWAAVSPYTSDRFKEELQGLADGSELPLEMLRRAHMIPVMGDYACSGVIVWGDAATSLPRDCEQWPGVAKHRHLVLVISHGSAEASGERCA